MGHPIPDAALDDRLAFVGTSGSGKTYAAGTAVERLLNTKKRVVILDPTDVWWGLRSQADGKRPAYAIPIFGGAHGDLPLNESAGALIGETVATMAESCIVSLGGFASSAADRRFMLSFLEALYRKASGEPFHLIVDEADLFAPQKPQKGDERLLHFMEQIVRRGRVKGFIPWLISQRPAVLNKNVLSQADGLIALKLTSSQDRDAIGAWIEGQADRQQGKDMLASLPGMQRGQGVVWIPGRGILATSAFPVKSTFDSSRTPKRGEAKRTASLQPLDLNSLKDKLAKVADDAKANDPAELKKQIADLQRQMRQSSKAASAPVVDQTAIERAYQKGVAQERARADRVIAAIGKHIIEAIKVGQHTANAERLVVEWLQQERSAPPSKPGHGALPIYGAKNAPTPKPIDAASDGKLGPERRVLAVLASRHPARLTEAQWATMAGMKRTSGTWGTYKSRLRTGNLIEADGNLWGVTESGFAAIGGQPPAADNPIDVWRNALGPERRMFDLLVEAYPNKLTREEIAARLEMVSSSGTFGTYLSRLRSNNLAEVTSDGVRATNDLMEA
jgi:hypothetical protein